MLGIYIAAATVGVFIYCEAENKSKASTLSLSVLLTVQLLNALNFLSEDCSLLQRPPWTSPWLLLVTAGSLLLHCAILYIPICNEVFGATSLTAGDWVLVLLFASPVLLVGEALKTAHRQGGSPLVHSHNKRD